MSLMDHILTQRDLDPVRDDAVQGSALEATLSSSIVAITVAAERPRLVAE